MSVTLTADWKCPVCKKKFLFPKAHLKFCKKARKGRLTKMGGRYLVSGGMLGELLSMAEYGDEEEIRSLVTKIIENHFAFNSKDDLLNDVRLVNKLVLKEREPENE